MVGREAREAVAERFLLAARKEHRKLLEKYSADKVRRGVWWLCGAAHSREKEVGCVCGAAIRSSAYVSTVRYPVPDPLTHLNGHSPNHPGGVPGPASHRGDATEDAARRRCAARVHDECACACMRIALSPGVKS